MADKVEKSNVGGTPKVAKVDRSMADNPPRTRGHTYIEDDVVSVIARIAAEQVDGVHQIGSSNLRGMIARLGRHGGVDSEIGLKEAAVDIELIVEFGYPIRDVTEELREQVVTTVENTTGRKVVEVNIWVVDVHVPRVETRPQRQLE